eukprot:1142236-Rhodomonas_salina.3
MDGILPPPRVHAGLGVVRQRQVRSCLSDDLCARQLPTASTLSLAINESITDLSDPAAAPI